MDPSAPPVGSVRPVRDADGPALIALIGGVYAEYPGCVLDLPGIDDDLPRMREFIADHGGAFWVVTPEGHDRAVVASGGWIPIDVAVPAEFLRSAGLTDHDPALPFACAELCRLYVREDQRGRGLGAWMVGRIEDAARRAGHAVIELWSDTRFLDAHRLYERLGYTRSGETRQLHDPSDTTEFRFLKAL